MHNKAKKVILIDGDIRHPHLHRLFGIENQKGLADLIENRLDIKSAFQAAGNIEGLILIPGGIAADKLAGWMDAGKLSQLLLELQGHADLVIVDGPSPDIADAQVFASQMNAILLVIRLGKTRVDAAQATLKRFQLIGGKVIGAVVNRPPRNQLIDMQILSRMKIKRPKSKDPVEVNKAVDKTLIYPP